MKKKILLAVDDSVHSVNAIRYAVRMSSFVPELSYTLFHGQPACSLYLIDEARTDYKAQAVLEKLYKKNAENSLKVLEKCKLKMIEAGVSADRIELKTQPRKIGLAADILETAQEGSYDAIVIGRRGLTKLQEVFMGSLTTKLLEHSRVIPVWVVDGDIKSSKIMLAIDGSESSLRAIDHFSFMVGKNPDVTITLLHVIPADHEYCPIDFKEEEKELRDVIIRSERKCVDSFFVHARKKFRDSGIQDSQLEIREIKCRGSAGKTIAEEIAHGNYGTVVMGRRGVHKAFFIGSVSQYVMERVSNCALWLVP